MNRAAPFSIEGSTIQYRGQHHSVQRAAPFSTEGSTIQYRGQQHSIHIQGNVVTPLRQSNKLSVSHRVAHAFHKLQIHIDFKQADQAQAKQWTRKIHRKFTKEVLIHSN